MEGIERIRVLSQEQKDTNIKKVAEYLMTRVDLDEKFMNEEKNLNDMWEYIKKQAKEKAVNGCAVMEDDDVYGLAVHYFDETNEALGIKASKKETKATKQEKIPTKVDSKEKQKEEVPTHKDDDIVMKYKGRPVTYKEFKDGTYLQLS